MIDPLLQALKDMAETTSVLVRSTLECEDCGFSGNALHPPFVASSVKFECPKCKSRNTERYCAEQA